jgi:uncharacterized protein (TIGR02246 family)
LTLAQGSDNTGCPDRIEYERARVLAKFDMQQALAVVEIQQLISDWAHELDVHNGLHVGELVTEDCTYGVGGTPREGRAAIERFYKDRLERLSAQPEGAPTHRHTLSNLRVDFRALDEASITFTLIYFTTAGMASGLKHADPAAVADVRMDCRREREGRWLIARFDSNQTFRRVPA